MESYNVSILINESDQKVKDNIKLDYQTLDLIVKSNGVWFDDKGHSVVSVHIGLENDATIYISEE
ncbi:hypothetical protein H9635_12250 [Solibacillus sp. A46]|uniref:Uncharacterized protein n=1 Tax=Solibacillus faecavium TaxID=2762221 RepID=A0ABR8XZY6_9BACL|nr:hypothetical protein [Solibacillus faecavium]MBD8037516.1 hypothetical protein [Solibacillus faecavium]